MKTIEIFVGTCLGLGALSWVFMVLGGKPWNPSKWRR